MPLTFTYFGHAAFQLESEGTTVLIDPFISGNPTATVDATDLAADTIILTHAHNDHVGDTIEIAKRTGATVIATFELATWLGEQGVASTVAANHGGTVAFGGGSIKFTPAWHTSSFQTGDGFVAAGLPAGLVVRFGGKTTYFAGDTCLFLDMQLIGDEDLDVAVLPIGDHYTMGPKDALRAVEMLRAPTIIPSHYNTFPPIEQDVQKFRNDVERATASRVIPLAPGESTDL
jgi:L-ascorbate metabolism protein UlaG (beta-lactamase superfamily)